MKSDLPRELSVLADPDCFEERRVAFYDTESESDERWLSAAESAIRDLQEVR